MYKEQSFTDLEKICQFLLRMNSAQMNIAGSAAHCALLPAVKGVHGDTTFEQAIPNKRHEFSDTPKNPSST